MGVSLRTVMPLATPEPGVEDSATPGAPGTSESLTATDTRATVSRTHLFAKGRQVGGEDGDSLVSHGPMAHEPDRAAQLLRAHSDLNVDTHHLSQQ